MPASGPVRLVNFERVQMAELTATPRGLVESVSELAWFHGHSEVGRPRRALSEVVRASRGRVGDALEAVRGDELLEQGWSVVKSDPQLLASLADRSPWREWLAVRANLAGLSALWSGWASPELLESLSAIERVQVSLTTLYVRTREYTFECALPLEPVEVKKAPLALQSFLATHARVRALRLVGFGTNDPSVSFEHGWSPTGFTCSASRVICASMVGLLEARR